MSSLKDSLKYLKHAQLDLYCTQSDATARTVFVSGIVDNSWQERTLNGALRNANTNWSNNLNRLGSQKSVVDVGNLTYDVTSWVNDKTTNGLVTFKMQDLTYTNTAIKVASKENVNQAYQPKLTLSFYDMTSAGIKPIQINETKYRLFPNPSTSFVTVEGNNVAEVNFMTTSGQFVSHSNANKIDVSAFPKGIYLVNVKSIDGKVALLKFVKN